jgi:hypothetical protein
MSHCENAPSLCEAIGLMRAWWGYVCRSYDKPTSVMLDIDDTFDVVLG